MGQHNRNLLPYSSRSSKYKIKVLAKATLPLNLLGKTFSLPLQLLLGPGAPWFWKHNSSLCLHLYITIFPVYLHIPP